VEKDSVTSMLAVDVSDDKVDAGFLRPCSG
jgi:hypothetical protein